MRTGDRFGSFRIVEKVGDGGMGEVYRAEDANLGRTVALKILRPDLADNPTLVERFRSEARLLARLEHPNIATVFNLLDEGSRIALVMEFVGGGSLAALLRQRQRLSPEDAVAYVLQILHGVGYAHGAGVVHRDLKPSNVMLSEQGNVKLVDFGIARVIGSGRLTRSGHLVGTLEYMAPEQVKGGEGDARSDLYAVGIILFELLAGRLPFEGDTDYDLIRAQVEQAPPSLADLGTPVDEALEAVLRRALEKEPEARFLDAATFAQALGDAVPEARHTVPPLPKTQPFAVRGAWRRFAPGLPSERIGLVLACLLALVVAAEGAYLASGWVGDAAPPERREDRIVRSLESDAGALPERATSASLTPRAAAPIRATPPDAGTGSPPPRRAAPAPPPRRDAGSEAKPKPRPKPARTSSQAVARLGTQARILAIDVHGSMRRSGILAKPAGYNVKVAVSGAAGVIDEVLELRRGGQVVLREVVNSQQRRPGRFRSRRRVFALAAMDPGVYEARLAFESRGRVLARHDWSLTIK